MNLLYLEKYGIIIFDGGADACVLGKVCNFLLLISKAYEITINITVAKTVNEVSVLY
jgi:hypothetical protein